MTLPVAVILNRFFAAFLVFVDFQCGMFCFPFEILLHRFGALLLLLFLFLSGAAHRSE